MARANPSAASAAALRERPEPARRVFVVVNDKAGNADQESLREALARHLGGDATEVELFVRDRSGGSRRKVARRAVAAGYDTIVAAGGDGTVSRVADELQGSGCRLGIVPLGTGNLIARALGIPMEVEDAVRVIAEAAATRAIDGMRVGDKTYFSHVSMGTYSRIAKVESETQKKWLGRGVYVWNLIRELARRRAWTFTIEADGRRRRRRASLVIVANIGDAGLAGMQWGSDIHIDDQRLDVCVVRGRSLRAYAELAWKSLRGRPEDGAIDYVPVHRRATIRSGASMPVRADGKRIGKGSVEVELVRAAVPVIVAAT